jgi:outer membrane protein assembly factor BamB
MERMNRIMKLVLSLMALPALSFAQLNVLTYHYNNQRTGSNPHETILTPANVGRNTFGKLFSVPIDSWSTAQPLYVSKLPGIVGGTHNVVYVATLNNSVYAFDADSGLLLWQQNFGVPSPMPLGPIVGFVQAGIVGTPAIDRKAGMLYFVAKTGLGTSQSPYALYLHAISLTTGLEAPFSPVLINPSVPGVTYYPDYQMSRAGVLVANGNVYIALGSCGSKGQLPGIPAINNHGWLLAYQQDTFDPVGVFVTTPATNNGGIWESGGAIAMDKAGFLYVATADALFDANISGNDYGDSVLKLSPTLSLVDYFTPYNYAYLNQQDLDVGSGGPVVINNSHKGTHYPELLVQSGKTEEIYLLNRDNLGESCTSCTSTNSNIVQDVPTPPNLSGCLPPVPPAKQATCRYGGPAYWNTVPGTATGYLYFPEQVAYKITDGVIAQTPIPSDDGYENAGPPIVTSNGSTQGIAWYLRHVGNAALLIAYNALTMEEIYNTSQAAGGRDALGPIAHFDTPMVIYGKAYVTTIPASSAPAQLVVYGLLSPK